MSGIPMRQYPTNAIANSENMLSIIGRENCPSLISSSLTSCSNKLHWAVNNYFRSLFIDGFPSAITAQNPTVKTVAHHSICSQKSCSTSSSLGLNIVTSIPSELILKVIEYLDFRSLNRWYSINKKLRSACSSPEGNHIPSSTAESSSMVSTIYDYDAVQQLWFLQLFYNLFVMHKSEKISPGLMIGGVRPSCALLTKSAKSGIKGDVECPNKLKHNSLNTNGLHCIISNRDVSLNAYQLFQLCHTSERSKTCLYCWSKASVVPVVYGFPSQLLIEQYRVKKLLMGGDYLLEGTATYICLNCAVQFFSYPYWCREIQVPVEQNRQHFQVP
jgi:hypothetical protein